MKLFTTIIVTALALSMAPNALACSSQTRPKKTSDLVVDGKGHFTNETELQIDVLRTVRGPKINQLIISDAAPPKDSIWVACAPSPYLFEAEPYRTRRDFEGRFFLKADGHGNYRISKFVERGQP